jgi:hypothetical protein
MLALRALARRASQRFALDRLSAGLTYPTGLLTLRAYSPYGRVRRRFCQGPIRRASSWSAQPSVEQA